MSICGIPAEAMEVVKVEHGLERWCFGERKRRAGTYTLTRPTLDYLMATEAWGWAEPRWGYRCDGCGGDYRLGFGRVWDEAWTIFGEAPIYSNEHWEAPVPRVGDRVTLGEQVGTVLEVHWHLNAFGKPIAEVMLLYPGHGQP